LALSERFLKDIKTPAVLELSSFQLEIENHETRAADVAAITNIYQDHINRHDTIKIMYSQKRIFKNQKEGQSLVLNFDNEWTQFFVNQKSKSKIYFFSLRILPKNKYGLYVHGNTIVFRDEKKEAVIYGEQTLKLLWARGEHNLYNFLAAALASFLSGISWKEIEKRIATLPDIFLRQEVIIKKKNFTVVNDSAERRDAAIAALKRFSREENSLHHRRY
jgi:UDP-N-acetylmuramoylalanine-D-glutamate ligase